MPHLIRLILMLAGSSLLAWSCAANLHQSNQNLEQWRIDEAVFSESDEGDMPLLFREQKGKHSRLVQLPHNWDQPPRVKSRDGWYRFDYIADQQLNDIQVIYLPRLNMNAAVYINGDLLNVGGSFEEPVSRNWNRPLFFVIPGNMLHPGKNHFTIHIRAYQNSGGGLGKVYVGPMRALEPSYKMDFRLFISTTIISCAMTIALGLAMLLFWYLRKESMFFWFALLNFFSAFYLSNHFVQNIPVSRHLWEWSFQISIDAFAFCLMLFTHRWLELRRYKWELGIAVYLLLAMVVLFLLPDAMMTPAFNLNHMVFLTVGLYVVFMLYQAWLSQHNHWLLLPLGALLLLFSLSMHDCFQLLHGTANNDHFLMPLGEPLFLAVIAAFLVRYFVQTHKQSARFAEELQRQVTLATRKLETQHQQLKAFEHAQLIKEERERILQELHDGIGGQLISAISLASESKQEALKHTLQDALMDLRLVIDSLDEETRDLASLLGMLRFRLEPALRARNITMEWQVSSDVETEQLGYEATLNLLRIVQEAINNSVRHANASRITVSMVYLPESSALMISVSDNGHGMGKHKAGRGLGHMQRRAQRIKATLDIFSDDKGTSVQVYLPLKPQSND